MFVLRLGREYSSDQFRKKEKEKKFVLLFSSMYILLTNIYSRLNRREQKERKKENGLLYYSSALFHTFYQYNNNMVLLTLVVVILFLALLCYYIKRVYFTLHGPIPGLSPQFLVGNLLQTGVIGKNIPLNLVFLDLKAKFGDIFQYWLGSTRIIVVGRLEDVQHIYSHRHIYDQGDIFTKKISLVNPYAILCLKGLNIIFLPVR